MAGENGSEHGRLRRTACDLRACCCEFGVGGSRGWPRLFRRTRMVCLRVSRYRSVAARLLVPHNICACHFRAPVFCCCASCTRSGWAGYQDLPGAARRNIVSRYVLYAPASAALKQCLRSAHSSHAAPSLAPFAYRTLHLPPPGASMVMRFTSFHAVASFRAACAAHSRGATASLSAMHCALLYLFYTCALACSK